VVSVFHLTVDAEANVKVWHNRQEAEYSETGRYMCLTLTPQQRLSIQNVAAAAKDDEARRKHA